MPPATRSPTRKVKAALKAASFELLVGFQLSDTALAYNIAK